MNTDLDLKQKLEAFTKEMGFNDVVIEQLMTTLIPLIDNYVLLSIENTLGADLLNALRLESEKRNYSDEESVRFVIFAYEKKVNKPIIHLIEEYLEEFIKEMTKSHRLIKSIVEKVVKNNAPEKWEAELNAYAESMDKLIQKRNNLLLGDV